MKRIITIVAMAALAGCVTTSSREAAGTSRLKSVIVPEVDFRDAAMSDVVEFVANSWHCVCHPWIHPTQRIEGDSVTYHFHVDDYDPHDPDSSIGLVKGTNKTSFVRLGPMVTFHAEKINIHDLLTQLVEQVGGSLEIRGNDVTIKTKKVEPSSPPYSERAADDPF
jgi:hypothetical protein